MMLQSSTHLTPFLLVSLIAHGVIFISISSPVEICLGPRGTTEKLSVRLVAAGAEAGPPTRDQPVGGAVPQETVADDEAAAAERAGDGSHNADEGVDAKANAGANAATNPEADGNPPSEQAEATEAEAVSTEAARSASAETAADSPPSGDPTHSAAATDSSGTAGSTETAEAETKRADGAIGAESRRRTAQRSTGAEPTAATTAAGSGGTDERTEVARRARAEISTSLAEHFRYPRIARQRGWEGDVVLRFEITASGHIRGVAIAESSGRRMLDEAAREALRAVDTVPEIGRHLSAPLELEMPVRYRLQSARTPIGYGRRPTIG